MGVMLFSINPFLAFVQRFIPRLLDGICLGYIFRGVRKVSNTYVACAVTGFFSAFLNPCPFRRVHVRTSRYRQESCPAPSRADKDGL